MYVHLQRLLFYDLQQFMFLFSEKFIYIVSLFADRKINTALFSQSNLKRNVRDIENVLNGNLNLFCNAKCIVVKKIYGVFIDCKNILLRLNKK